MNDPSDDLVLLVRAGPHACGLPLRNVAETMRPLAVTPLAGVPSFVQGVAIARGRPAPVVLLGALLAGEAGGAAPARWVRVTTADRQALLAVDAVVGVATVRRTETLPLLARAAAGAIDAIASLDGELLALLDTAQLLPDDAWRALAAEERA